MQGLLKGSQAFREAIEKGQGGGKFLKLSDGESATIRFLQELDETGKNYVEERGVGVGFYEHLNPEDFAQSFKCTRDDEGHCVGCELVPADKKWRARGRLLINAVVRNKDGADEVKIFSTSLSSKGLAPQLVEFSEDYGSLCDRDYKLTRRGEGIATTYTIIPREVSAFTKADKEADLVDWGDIIRTPNYEEQKELLGKKEDW